MTQSEITAAIAQCRDAVVMIECRDIGSKGSGFFISNSGRILTNNHVVSSLELVSGTLQNTYSAQVIVHHAGNQYPATIENDQSNPKPVVFDYAILSISLPAPSPALNVRSLTEVQQGDTVVCLGYPLNFDSLIATHGTVSAFISRPSHVNTLHAIKTVLTDCPINRGNSGGPMIHASTQSVIGVNTLKHSVQDLMWARLARWKNDPRAAGVPGLIDLIDYTLYNADFGLNYALSLEYASADPSWSS